MRGDRNEVSISFLCGGFYFLRITKTASVAETVEKEIKKEREERSK